VRYKFVFWILILFSISYLGFSASGITGDEIINEVDKNMTFTSARMESKMLIHVGKQVRTKKMISYAQGKDKSFAKFTSPARDKGVKYLKIGDNMWMYLPSVDKIIKIAGHMLRQSMMGSDFSYEDALESNKLLEKYKVTLIGQDEKSYILELTAKVKKVTYYKRKIWVDKRTFIPTREELFAKSGKKLKVMTMGEVKRFGRRYYPTYMTIENLLRRDSKTELFTTKAQFDIRIPAGIFSQANLKK